jgi:hypothetical protein
MEAFAAVPPLLYRSRMRAWWGWAAFWAALWAVILEASLHPLASLVFDPIGNYSTLLLYVFVVATLGVNEVILDEGQGRWLYEHVGWRRMLGLALASTVVSLLVTVTVCIMFAPIMFMAVPFIVFGLPIFLYVPLLALLVLCRQLGELRWTWDAIEAPAPVRRRIVGATGLLAVTVLAWVIGRPFLTAHYVAVAESGDTGQQKQAITALRLLHGEDTLLDMAYRRAPSFWVTFAYVTQKHGFSPMNGFNGYQVRQSETSDFARKAYFFVTGQPFEQAPRPASYARQQFLFDRNDEIAIEETGGLVVGRKIPGLSLKTSEIQGKADPEARVAVYEWTMRFRNDTNDPQEARADIRIPTDAVVHKVSLWVNGEERPAAFGHPQKVREAYQSVAVVQRKDPLLVTMPAPGHVLAQCFPVPAHGEMQIRIGVTSPLREVEMPGNNVYLFFDPSAFGPVNFDMTYRLTHQLSMSETIPGGGLITRKSPMAGDLIFRSTPMSLSPSSHSVPGTAPSPQNPTNIILVRDASAGMNDRVNYDALIATISELQRNGATVQVMDTDTGDSKLTRWAGRRFAGGTDPAPVLAEALERARDKAGNHGVVVFLHAASPHNVSDPTPLRKALQKDFYGGPPLIFVEIAPNAPDALYMDLAGFPMVQTVMGSHTNTDHLSLALAQVKNAKSIAKSSGSNDPLSPTNLSFLKGLNKGTAGIQFGGLQDQVIQKAIHHLGFGQAVRQAWYRSNSLTGDAAMDYRVEAGKLAATNRLVTPLSSAVVLETKQQYKEHGLDDGTDEQEATAVSPEPGTLGLVAFGAFGGAAFWRRRFRRADG